jgi:hypothetical protein
MKLRKKTRQKIKEKRIGSRDKKLQKEKGCAKIGHMILDFLLVSRFFKINLVWFSFSWWTGRDLNPRLPRCERGDHTELIYRPKWRASGIERITGK